MEELWLGKEQAMKWSNKWPFLRILRLTMALFFLIDVYYSHSPWMLILGLFLLYQGIFHKPCLGSCQLPYSPKNNQLKES